MREYRQRLRKRRYDVFKCRAEHQLDNHHHGVYATLNITWPSLSPGSQSFISMLAFVNYTHSPVALIYRAAKLGFSFERFNLTIRPAPFRETVQRLCNTFNRLIARSPIAYSYKCSHSTILSHHLLSSYIFPPSNLYISLSSSHSRSTTGLVLLAPIRYSLSCFWLLSVVSVFFMSSLG